MTSWLRQTMAAGYSFRPRQVSTFPGLFLTAAFTREFGSGWPVAPTWVRYRYGVPSPIAAVSDASHPVWRARSLSVYRFWRDFGYAIGALTAGIIADLFWIGLGNRDNRRADIPFGRRRGATHARRPSCKSP